MARCSECNKFVSYDESTEPEAELDVDDEGRVTGSIRVVLCCVECGTEMKEALFDVADKFDVGEAFKKHKEDDHANDDEDADVPELEVEADCEMAVRTEGKGRGTKTYYGYHATITVVCSCGVAVGDAELDDDLQASYMDEV